MYLSIMYKIERVEFYLPRPSAIQCEDVTDSPFPTTTSIPQDVDEHGPPTQQTLEGSCVTQPTENRDEITFAFGAVSKPLDVTDSNFESFKERLDKLPADQVLYLKYLAEDVEEGRCKLDFCRDTGRVVVHNIQQEAKFAGKIPENTLKIANKSNQKILNTEEFCDFLDDLRHKKPPAGVVLNDELVTLGPGQQYGKDSEFYIIPNVRLGEGLQATIQVSVDKGSGSRHAVKSVPVNNFQSNEIRAMVALKDYSITPKLYACHLHQNKVFLHMEKLENCVTIEDVIKQCGVIEHNAYHRFSFALHILIELSEALSTIHSRGWFHRDLHSGNVMIQRSGRNDVSVKIIDFGNAKRHTTKGEDNLSAMKSDVYNMLRQFCSLVLGGDWFEDIFDFERNFDQKIKEMSVEILPSSLKESLRSILQIGFNVKSVVEQGLEEVFISKLQHHKVRICAQDIAVIVSQIIFRPELDCKHIQSDTQVMTGMEKLGL